ncbi:MAG: cell envelope integrity protein CreD [Prolixibacteraceae bacterium]
METNQIPGHLKAFNWQLTLKVFIIGIVMLLLLIPKFMIIELIREREATSQSAKQEVTGKWSHAQTVRGPVLTIPYVEKITDADRKTVREEIRECHFLPETLNIDGEIVPRELTRSIYKTVVYESVLNLSGRFTRPAFEKLKIDPAAVLWGKATLSVSISDLRGINAKVNLLWDGKSLPFSPGMDNKLIGTNGISVALPDTAGSAFPSEFRIRLEMKGSDELLFAPVGETTTVRLRSSWNDPGFQGSFLPAERNISAAGFDARWKVLDFNRNFPQEWIDTEYAVTNSDFGVRLVETADHYQKSSRSTKYAILVILLVFLSFFLNEILTKQKIHPFQYILVGFAVLVFYLLLLSLSEQLGFNAAYLISALSVTGMVLAYSKSFLKTWTNAMILTLILALSFGFIFVLMQLETLALLTGSVGLFVVLGLTMFLTRKIDWYNE